MSWFPGTSPFHGSTYSSPHGGFLRTSPSPQPSQHQEQQMEMDPDKDRDDLQDARGAAWHAPIPQGLGLLTLPVTTDSPFRITTTLEPSAHNSTNISLGCPSEFSSSAPPTRRPDPIRKDSWSDQSCDPLSTILPSALWDYLRPRASSVGGYDTSPGRSDYSRSSHPSAVSSPCAHSDVYVQRVDSPQIKIEYPSDHAIPQIHFVSDDTPDDQSQLLVQPSELMKVDETSIEERVKTYLSSSASSDIGDHYDHVEGVPRRAHSFAEFSNLSLNRRSKAKRTYTKPENASFRCDKCGKPFQRGYNLRSHIANVHNRHHVKHHACDYEGCTHSFVRKTDLTRHISSVCTCIDMHKPITDLEQVHHRLRDFKCDLCGKDFPRKDTLIRRVLTIRPFFTFSD